MRRPIGIGGMFLMVAGIALTVAAFRDDAPDSMFAPFKWFGPVLLGSGLLMLALIWLVIRD
jgi:hypothetical protein